MLLPVFALLAGIALLAFAADRFVDGAAAAARHARMPPLVIGMLVVGFGTSAPEMVVSGFAAHAGNPGIALGNAYGSNITNIGLILGLSALLAPVAVRSRVLRRELPVLAAVTLLAFALARDGGLSRADAWVHLGVFAGLIAWSVLQAVRQRGDSFGVEVAAELRERTMPLGRALFWLSAGLVLLVAGSRVFVWGAVELARGLGVSDLVIGLTIVALGTSLPELASSVAAARKNEHDIALGNVLGSNLFNTLAVVGIAGAIRPFPVAPEVLFRDFPIMAAFTLAIFALGFGLRGPGRINRPEGALLLAAWIGYTAWLVTGA